MSAFDPKQTLGSVATGPRVRITTSAATYLTEGVCEAGSRREDIYATTQATIAKSAATALKLTASTRS